jgi:4-amino-4-deoxy-L-arabinose transferase-like glycosyltransferase
MSRPALFFKAALPIASIFLILAGIVQLRAQVWVVGAICLILAMAGFILSMRLLENSPFSSEEIEILEPFVIPALLWTIVLSLLTISVSYVADDFVSVETNRLAALMWVGSVILGLLIVWRKSLHPDKPRLFLEGIKTHRTELIVLTLILVLAFALRTIDLTNHPYPWSGDEASVGKEARRILNGEVTNFFDTGWSSQPNWSFVPTAISLSIFGDTIAAVRFPSALAGALAVLFLYLAARELFNPAVALMAATFLATLPYNLHFSRIGVNNIMDTLVSSMVIWLLAAAYRRDDTRLYYTAGAIAGLAIYTYVGTRLVLILAVGLLFFFVMRQRSYLRSHWKHLVAFVVAAAVSAAPQAAFFVRHPVIFIGRLGQEGIFLNGWLPQHAAQTGKSVPEILFDQLSRTVMVFIATPAVGNFFGSPYPYLTIFGSILSLVGMGYALAYLLRPQHFIILAWFWAVILFGGILTMNPPANTRLLMTSPPVALFMALGTYKIAEYLRRFRLLPEQILIPLFLVVVSIITFQNIKFYMFEYRKNLYFQDANSEYAMEVGLMAKTLGADYEIFVLGEPRVNTGIPTLSYIAPDNPRVDFGASNLETLALTSNQKAAFFAIPENQYLLAEIRQRYPGGRSGLVYRKPRPNEVLFEYYIVTAG